MGLPVKQSLIFYVCAYVWSNSDAFPDSALKVDTGLHTQSVTERTYRYNHVHWSV